jgi:hypothetical protein
MSLLWYFGLHSPRMYCMHSTKAPLGGSGPDGDSVWDEIVVADQHGVLGQRPGKGGIDSTSNSSCPVGCDNTLIKLNDHIRSTVEYRPEGESPDVECHRQKNVEYLRQRNVIAKLTA